MTDLDSVLLPSRVSVGMQARVGIEGRTSEILGGPKSSFGFFRNLTEKY